MVISDWKKVKFESLAADVPNAFAMGPFGSNIKSENFVEDGVPIIRGKNLKDGQRFSLDEFVYLTEDKADKLRASNAFPEDLVFTHRGTLGQVGIIPSEPYKRYVVSQSQMKMTANKEVVSPLFLFYYFNSIGKIELLKNTSGSGVPAISSPLNTLKNLRINLPPLPTQQKIASILSAYDDLMENNNKRIALLEEMASEIYKEWFVRLRFPNYKHTIMVDGIPDGWEKKRLKDFGKVVTGKTPSTKRVEYFNGKIPFIKTPDFSTNAIFVIKTKETLTKEGMLSQKNQTIPKGTICVSCIGTAGEMGITSKESQTNQQINSLTPKEDHYLEFLFFAIKRLKPYIELYGSSGATMVNLSKSKFEDLKVLIPNDELIIDYSNITCSMFKEIEILSKKNNLLQQTRDLLLPRLISGKLEV